MTAVEDISMHAKWQHFNLNPKEFLQIYGLENESESYLGNYGRFCKPTQAIFQCVQTGKCDLLTIGKQMQ